MVITIYSIDIFYSAYVFYSYKRKKVYKAMKPSQNNKFKNIVFRVWWRTQFELCERKRKWFLNSLIESIIFVNVYFATSDLDGDLKNMNLVFTVVFILITIT